MWQFINTYPGFTFLIILVFCITLIEVVGILKNKK